MKRRGWIIWALALVVAVVAAPAVAQVSRETPVVLAYRKARPAVVNISAEKLVQATSGLFGGGDPFEDIFPSPLARKVPVQSLGSGIVIDPSGYIVTNAHVVRKADKVTVTFPDMPAQAARIISADPRFDLAVLKMDPPEGKSVPYLPLGRSDDLMVGETVIAIGNPLGYANSLTTGVVSATNRELEFSGGVKYTGLIQIDAPINPGNSGGPLLNINGELIGLNTAIRSDAQNIGFAIPVDALAAELPELLNFERINRVIFGADVVQRHGAAGDQVVVSAVRAGTPAARFLQAGDILVGLNDAPVRQVSDYTCQMLALRAGRDARLTIRREGKVQVVSVTLAAKPKPDGRELARKLFGMTLREVNAEVARELRLSVDRGLLVEEVEPGGPAALLGVKPRDVIFLMDRFFVLDLEGLGVVLEEVKAGQTIRIGLVRQNVRAYAQITAGNVAPAPRPAPPKLAPPRLAPSSPRGAV